MMQEFVQNIKDTVKEELADVHTAIPGKIVSVDAGSGTCTVLPVMKKKASNGSLVDYPKISGVPLVFPQGSGQGCSVVYPVSSGDGCLIIVAEQSIDYWLYGRETDSDLRFDITNAICIPGLFQQLPATFGEACELDAVIVEADTTRLIVKPDGIEMVGNLKVKGKIEAEEITAEKTIEAESITAKEDVTAGDISLKEHTHTSAIVGDDTSGPK